MSIAISHSTVGRHRDTNYIATCRIYNGELPMKFYIGERFVTIVKLEDQSWWIVANRHNEVHLFDDVGPYITAEDAAVMLRLLATNVVS